MVYVYGVGEIPISISGDPARRNPLVHTTRAVGTVTRAMWELKVGDVIFSVDGIERDEIANTAELYIKLRKTAGDVVTLGVIRDGKRMSMKLTTYRLGFRK